jgi:hypothetical protein
LWKAERAIQAMSPISNRIMLVRLAGMLVVCVAVPPLLCHYVGAVYGAGGASGAAALWYSQYRLPSCNKRSGSAFWFVPGGIWRYRHHTSGLPEPAANPENLTIAQITPPEPILR